MDVEKREIARFFGLSFSLQVEAGGEIFEEGIKKQGSLQLIPTVLVDILWIGMDKDSDPLTV